MINVGRMLSAFNDNSRAISIGVLAKLAADFSFTLLDGEEVDLKEGTVIHVDEDKGIASYNDLYFSVDPIDYIVSFSN